MWYSPSQSMKSYDDVFVKQSIQFSLTKLQSLIKHNHINPSLIDQLLQSDYYLVIILFKKRTMDEVVTQRVYIDPERLIKLKKSRKSLKLVPSIYEPPTEITNNQYESQGQQSISLSLKSRSKNLVENNLSSEIVYKTKNANIQFIVALMGEIKSDQLIELEEGDCLNIRLDQRWLILEGEVKITGNNNHSYTMEDGYFFFVSSQSKKKIKEIVCLRQTKILRIYNYTYQSYLKNYMFLKNAEKIKYLKYCPFFLWSDQLSEDLASCMKFCTYQRDEVIYSPHNPATQIFFVKEGVVLLQRNQRPTNSIIKQYEGHYQNNQINQNQMTLIVKKGMVFGIDGILLKELKSEKLENGQPIEEDNPQSFQNYNRRQKLNTRIYTARTIGKTQLYSIKREILETLFNEMDLLNLQHFPKQMTKGDLQRICADYADMVIRHRSLPKISQAIIRKDLVLQKEPSSIELQEKKINVKKIRFHQESVKKISIANIIPDRKNAKAPSGKQQQQSLDQNASLLNQLNYKLSLNEHTNDGKLFAFPSLSSNIKKRKFKVAKQQNMQKYILKWLKDSDPQREMKSRQMSKQAYKQRGLNSKQKKQFLINVRSYRNIIP